MSLKRTVADLDLDSEAARKRGKLSSNPFPTPPCSTQLEYPQQFGSLDGSSDWRQRLKSSLVRPLDKQHLPHTGHVVADSHLSAWLKEIPRPRSTSCPGSPHTGPPQSPPSLAHPVELQRSQSCPPEYDIVRSGLSASGSFALESIQPDLKRVRLTMKALHEMLRHQQPQHSESIGPRSTSSPYKPPGASDPGYIDTLYHHGINLDLSGRKIPKELEPLKEQILQERPLPQLTEEAVFEVMDTAEQLAYNTEGPTHKLLRTPMFPLGYGGLSEGGGTQWNTVALPNNPQYLNKLSTPEPDVYLAYPHGRGSPWTVQQANVVNHSRVWPYSQPTKRSTFPSIHFELKAESAGGVLATAEAQAAGSASHSVNAILWLLQEAKAVGLTDIDLLKDTVSFSIVASHRQAVAYLLWFEPEVKQFYMSYLRSFSTFEADAIRRFNNVLKNMIDHVNGPRKIQIGKALDALEPLILYDNLPPPPGATNSPTPNSSVSGKPRSLKRARES